MTTLQIIVLAIVQGLTEFLPISSSGHLVLVPAFFAWDDQGIAFDVAVHFGSLLAVCAFFRDDIVALLRGTGQLASLRNETNESHLALGLALGTVPAAIAGLAAADWIEANLRDPAIIVYTLAGYAILMVLADRYGRSDRNITNVSLRDAFLIGCAQALALVPGTSRSGVTITAGRILGFARQDAARFSFLLSVPVILLASIFKAFELITSPTAVSWTELGLAVAISGIVAYLSIGFFMRFVSRIGLLPFAVYRIALAAVIVYAVL